MSSCQLDSQETKKKSQQPELTKEEIKDLKEIEITKNVRDRMIHSITNEAASADKVDLAFKVDRLGAILKGVALAVKYMKENSDDKK